MPPVLPLTDAKIKNLAPKEKPYKVFDGRGLYLEVYPHGSKMWRVKYRFEGKDRRVSLGAYPEVGLREARDKAAEVRLKLRDGNDPAASIKRVEEEKTTFQEVVDDWAGRFLVLSQTAPATIKRKRIFLDKHILPTLGPMPMREIDPPVILKLMRKIEAQGHLETAHRVKMICSQIFRFGVAGGQVDRDPTQDLRGAVPPPKVKHRASIIDPAKIAKLLKDVWNYGGHAVVCHALKILPYVFVRPGELRHACWDEIDWPEKLWRIPAEKMKMKTPHLVPLSSQVIEILENLKKHTGRHHFLFPGHRNYDRPMSDMAVNAALRYLGYSSEEITGHGFRSMASTILNEQGYNRDWIERQLAHTERDGVRAAYNYAEYLPERRKMMQAWADYLDLLRLGV